MRYLPVLPSATPSQSIPAVLHQIWVGGEPPRWVRAAWGNWDEALAGSAVGWKVRRWTNREVGEMPVMARVARAAAELGLPPRGLADLVRVVAVSLFGGVYMDSDTVPVRDLAGWVGDAEPWLGGPAWSVTHPQLQINSGFALPAGHPFLAGVWARADQQLARGVRNEHWVAGPRTYRKVWEVHPVRRVANVEHVRKPPWTTLMRQGRKLDPEELGMMFPEAVAVHVVRYSGEWDDVE